MLPELRASCFIPIVDNQRNRPILRLFIFLSVVLGLVATTTAWARIEIDRASWNSDGDQLTVRGDNAPDNSTVIISYGEKDDNGAEIGRAQADNDGEWTFIIANGLNPVPCDVTAQAGGDDDDKEVRSAPSNCSNDGGGAADPNQPPTAVPV